jgi:hypothetical protein
MRITPGSRQGSWATSSSLVGGWQGLPKLTATHRGRSTCVDWRAIWVNLWPTAMYFVNE